MNKFLDDAFPLMIILCLLMFAAGWFSGSVDTEKRVTEFWQLEAVHAGKAYYYFDKDYNRKWGWKRD